jgi:surface antigen/LysM repeat protein
MSHALVLLIIAVIPGALLGALAKPEPAFQSRLTLAATPGTAGRAGGGMISKPEQPFAALPGALPKPETYVVQSGDVLGDIAGRYGLRLDTLRQSNNLVDADTLKIGQPLLIPPTNGVLVTVAARDTVESLASRYHVDQSSVVAYNRIAAPSSLAVGSLLMLPDGTGLLPAQAPQAQALSGSASPGGSKPSSAISFGRSAYNNFPFGQCTWWVASQRNIPWNGNAWEWFGQAEAKGRSTGRSPAVGSIMVTWENRFYGHVSLVEAVYGDGSWTVSEMNYQGWGIVDRRRIRPGSVPLIGFIY